MKMDQRQRRREGSQRAQASRERRLGAHAHRKKMNMVYMTAASLVAVVIIAVVVLLQGSSAELGIKVTELTGAHAPPYVYVQDVTITGEPVRIPPSSGNHFGQEGVYGFQGVELVPEAAVHNMEHGAVVLWYQPEDALLAGQIKQLVKSLGNQCIVAGSFADQSFEVSATVWGRALPQKTYDESSLRAFINKYRGELGPEAGLCRG